jgi:hypothetical protein
MQCVDSGSTISLTVSNLRFVTCICTLESTYILHQHSEIWVPVSLQIVMEADKIYGVSHSNRLSRVDLVTREDALEFVTAEQLRAKSNAQQEDAL